MVISRGKGVRVWDDTGKEYIESVAGLWCAALGFDNERLVQAAANQMRKLPFYHAFTAKSHEPMIDLAEMLIAARAGADEQGVLRQLRLRGERHRHQDGLVLQQRRSAGRDKKKIIGRLKGYHGITIALGVADRPAAQPPQLRRAAAGLHAHHDAALLPRRATRRDPRTTSRRAAPTNWRS